MIFLMISFTLVTPSATIFLMISSTFLASTLILAAKSLISLHTLSERTSVHLKFLANSTSLSRTLLMISLALVIFSFTNSRVISSIFSIFTFNFAAISLKSLHTFADSTSSHLTRLISSPSTPGKKWCLIAAMISLILVIPFKTNFLMYASTLAASTLISAAIFARTNLMIALALVIPFSRASRTALSTSSTLIFKILAASRIALHTLSERTSSQTMTLTSPGKKWCLIASMIALILVIPPC